MLSMPRNFARSGEPLIVVNKARGDINGAAKPHSHADLVVCLAALQKKHTALARDFSDGRHDIAGDNAFNGALVDVIEYDAPQSEPR